MKTHPQIGPSLRRTLPTLWICLGVVVACTWLAFHLHLNLATTGFLYLIVVIGVAMRYGFAIATAVSLASALALNYFFAPPLFSFSVSDPANWVALAAFELTAVVISTLSKTAADKTNEAVRERREAEALYQVSLRVFLFDRTHDPGNFLAGVIRECFNLTTVVLFDKASGRTYVSGSASPDVEQRLRHAIATDSNQFDSTLNTWFCVLRNNLKPEGGLALYGCSVRPLIATALASLCASSFERFRSFEREYRAEASRQAEQLRAAVLDSLAHQIKTPVATISAASSGLMSLGGLSETQQMLMSVLDEQSKKLNQIAPQLLRTAKLDSSTLAPRRELLQISDVVDETLQILAPHSGNRLKVSFGSDDISVLGDRKLLSDAIFQIVDNAFKYSAPGTPIHLNVEPGAGQATISVRNEGSAIPIADYERIFERFYRADASPHGVSGAGLGLPIVRRIAEAHQGRVWFESHAGATTFFLALPLAADEMVSERYLRADENAEPALRPE